MKIDDSTMKIVYGMSILVVADEAREMLHFQMNKLAM